MKSLCLAVILVLATFACADPKRASPKESVKELQSPLYELRIYHANPGKLDALHARFRDHTVALFEKHGMTNVGYWVPVENDGNILVYLLQYENREARANAWKGFLNDPEWKKAYAASTTDGKLVKEIESTFLSPTDWSPPLDPANDPQPSLFELRTYTTNPGKLENLHARFRDHTLALFEKHGMTNLPYFQVLGEKEDDEPVADKLIYFLAHSDEESRNKSFKRFSADPDWVAARNASEKDGKILVKGGVESMLLEATDYSPVPMSRECRLQ